MRSLSFALALGLTLVAQSAFAGDYSFSLKGPHSADLEDHAVALGVRIIEGRLGQVVVQGDDGSKRTIFNGNISLVSSGSGGSVAIFGSEFFLYAVNFNGEVRPFFALTDETGKGSTVTVAVSNRLEIQSVIERADRPPLTTDHYVVAVQGALGKVSSFSVWTDSDFGFGIAKHEVPASLANLLAVEQSLREGPGVKEFAEEDVRIIDVKMNFSQVQERKSVLMLAPSGSVRVVPQLGNTTIFPRFGLGAFLKRADVLIGEALHEERYALTVENTWGEDPALELQEARQKQLLSEYLGYILSTQSGADEAKLRSVIRAAFQVGKIGPIYNPSEPRLTLDLFPEPTLASRLSPGFFRRIFSKVFPFCNFAAAQGQYLNELWALKNPARIVPLK